MSESDRSERNNVASRKSHRKSRLGCNNCKQRHIKCDEKKPQCTNCSNHSIPCDYLAPPSSGADTESDSKPEPQHKSDVPSKIEYLFVESEYQTFLTPSSHQAPQAEVQPVFSDQLPFCFADFELQYHFLTVTCFTFVEDEGSLQFWKLDVPHLCFKFPFILHLTLALAGLHKSRVEPCLSKQCIARFNCHYSLGLRSLSTALSQLTSENSKAAWVGSILLCFIGMAKGPTEGDYLFFGDTQPAEWLSLIQGVSLLTSISNPQRPQTRCDETRGPWFNKAQTQQAPPAHVVRLAYLHELAEMRATSKAILDSYHAAIENLDWAFRSVFHEDNYAQATEQANKGTRFTFIIFTWVSQLGNDFLDALQRRVAVPLIILAHFLVLMNHINSLWFLQGWAAHVMRGIHQCLDESDHSWIQWPMEEVQKS